MKTETLIIIRTKNEDRWIKATIKKIINQSYKNYKIIVIDNNSKDRTLEILKKLNIETVKINKFLPGKAINLAINHFKNTKYIVCLSAHCLPETNHWLKKLIKPLKNPKTMAVYGKQMPMFSTNHSDYRDLKLVFGNEKRIQKKDFFFHNANSAIKRSILKKYPFSNTVSNMEDRIWSKKILSTKKNYQIVYEPDASVYHHHGLHHGNTKKRLDGVIKIIKSIEKDNLLPDMIDINNQNIYSLLIGNTPTFNIGLYLKNNYKLIKKLNQSHLIKKIIFIIDPVLTKKIKSIKSDKFIFLNRNKKINSSKVNELMSMIYRKFRNDDIDYLLYFNLDYISRPTNSINKLLSSINAKTSDIFTYALEEKSNIWLKKNGKYSPKNSQLGISKNSNIYLKAIYGLGSLFFFNSLKNKYIEKKSVEMLMIKNTKFLQRFSKSKYDE
jgi:glycosyltransferase involved in cell wall biosynthesis